MAASRINNFRLGRAVLAVVSSSWDLENVGLAVEIMLLSIAEAEISCGVANLSIECALCVIEEFFNNELSCVTVDFV